MTNSRPLSGASATASPDLRWLSRYAHHIQVRLTTSLPEANALRSCFTRAAWLLLCHSDRSSFVPILRNQSLCFDSLVAYTQALVNNGFQVAPRPELLDYLIQASYLFFDRMPSVPERRGDITLMRLATRHGEVSQEEFQRVHAWLNSEHGSVSAQMTWRSVLRRANDWQRRRQMVVDQERASTNGVEPPGAWDFACGTLPWRGYDIIPLTHEIALWDEGQPDI